jgi:hypothetical protein
VTAGLPETPAGLKVILGLINFLTLSANPGELVPPEPTPDPTVPPLPPPSEPAWALSFSILSSRSFSSSALVFASFSSFAGSVVGLVLGDSFTFGGSTFGGSGFSFGFLTVCFPVHFGS